MKKFNNLLKVYYEWSDVLSNDPKTEAEIRAFFDEFVEAYPKDDLDRYLNLFSQDENLVMFGTGEKWLGWEDYKNAPAEDKERHGEIFLSYDFDIKKTNLAFNLRLLNMLNKSYEVIRSYPSPGRSVYFSVIVSYKK